MIQNQFNQKKYVDTHNQILMSKPNILSGGFAFGGGDNRKVHVADSSESKQNYHNSNSDQNQDWAKKSDEVENGRIYTYGSLNSHDDC